MRAVIARAERVEPHVNAFAEELFEQALRAAAAAERRHLPGGRPRLLEGLPVAAKEEQPLAGHLVTDGTLLRPAYPARGDGRGPGPDPGGGRHSPCPHDHLGVLLHAVVAHPPLGCDPQSVEPRRVRGRLVRRLGGRPGRRHRHPCHRLGHRGSLRAPASFNGVVSYKPLPAATRCFRPSGSTVLPPRPMARTVADCALLQNGMAGPDPRDPASMRPAVRIPPDLEGVQRPARRLQHRAGGRPVDPEIRMRTRAAVEGLRAGGTLVLVAEVEIGWRLDEIKRALWAHFGRGDVAGSLALDSRRPGVITPYTLAFARRGMAADPTPDSAAGKKLEAVIHEQLDSVIDAQAVSPEGPR
ncbi:hypothetical protein KBZ75_33095 [Streptomyces sp. RK76]|nr:hypothetical protein [Streptomyces sp. RK76]